MTLPSAESDLFMLHASRRRAPLAHDARDVGPQSAEALAGDTVLDLGLLLDDLRVRVRV